MKRPLAPLITGHIGRLPVLLLVALCGCAYALVRNGKVNLSKADQVEDGLQNLRELSFKTPVPTVVMNPDQAENVMVEEIHRDYSDERLKIDGQSGAMIGLYPMGIDLRAEALKLLKSQVVGFYEPHRKEMILVSGTAELGFWTRATEFVAQRDVVGEMLLAHELTHALQDQHFSLDQKLQKLSDNDDRQLALKSVAEGDATLAGLAFVSGRMDDATASILVDRLDRLPAEFAASAQGAPEALSAPLIFQYSSGARFVGEAFHRGGWKAVDSLYLNPPQSSLQIMHPELYFDHPTPPADIALRGYETALREWQKADENTVGALMMRVLLKRNLGADASEVGLADKWTGDRMVVLRHGDSLAVLWLVLFRDEQSAQQFANAYRRVLDQSLGTGTPHRVENQSSGVLSIIGIDWSRYPDLSPAVWKSTVIRQAPPPSRPSVRASREPPHSLADQ